MYFRIHHCAGGGEEEEQEGRRRRRRRGGSGMEMGKEGRRGEGRRQSDK